jgi:SAM-dependent methyltransferase
MTSNSLRSIPHIAGHNTNLTEGTRRGSILFAHFAKRVGDGDHRCTLWTRALQESARNPKRETTVESHPSKKRRVGHLARLRSNSHAGTVGRMDQSPVIPAQVPYWDSVAGEKRFAHPLRLARLTRHICPRARILDFGSGYGRTLAELVCAGYENVVGVDFSFRMLKCCRSQLQAVRLVQNYGQTIPLQNHSVDLVLLFAVLTCIPRNEDQRDLLREIRRVLSPGGLLYISDLLLNHDQRNLERYDRYADEYGTYGIFELPDGVIVRHHQKKWIEDLTASFGPIEFESFEVTTMNSNKSAAFQYLGRAFPHQSH